MLEIVAIDGSTGAGKSSVAAALADQLGWPLLLTSTHSGPREAGEAGKVVAEGPGVLHALFPDARWKIYLEADPRDRAQRRARSTDGGGEDEKTILEQLLDANRSSSAETTSSGPLIPTDAILIDTTGIEQEAVVEIIAAWVLGDLE
jgi:cytidylate kinase